MKLPKWTVASALLAALLAPPTAAQDAEPSPEEILGSTAAFDLGSSDDKTVWVDEGSPLFELPDAASPRLEVIDVLSEFEVLERDGDWYKVRHGTRIGWVLPDLPWKDRVIEITEDVGPLAVTIPAVDVESLGRLSLARQLLGSGTSSRRLGPYELLTDVADPEVLTELSDIAVNLDAAYQERYGLETGEPGGQIVALFASEQGYREFERGTTDSPDAGRQGHAIGDLASLYLEKGQEAGNRALMIHELTHLLNRRALGLRLPPWIEEGLANDLSFSEVGRHGRLRLGSLVGGNDIFGTRYDRQIVFSGGLASLSQTLRARYRRQGTPLKALVGMGQEEFMAAGGRELHYAESAFLIRFFLDGPRDEWAEKFRDYLDSVAVGLTPSPDELSASLGATWPEIEGLFVAWLRVQSAHLLR
jgi:hypothetical protein